MDFSALNSGALEALGKGALVTVTISGVSILLGLVVGLGLAFMLLAPNAIIASFAKLYRSFWRGTPLLVQLFIVFYLPPKVGIDVPPFIAAVIALTMNTAAFQAEIYRAGLQAIPPGQVEAAQILGIGIWSIRLRILIPQMFRLVLPALINEIISILKNSSLVSFIAVTELMRTGQQIASASFRPLETYLIVGLIYVLLNSCLSLIGARVESHLLRSEGRTYGV